MNCVNKASKHKKSSNYRFFVALNLVSPGMKQSLAQVYLRNYL